MRTKAEQIIVVGDETIEVIQCIDMLTSKGYRVNAQRCVEQIEHAYIADAGLLIVNCPDDETLAVLSEKLKTTDMPVLALIENKPEVRQSIYSKGVSDFITKPLLCHELLFRVATIANYFSCKCQFKPIALGKCDGQTGRSLLALSNRNNPHKLVENTCDYLQSHIHEKLMLDDIALNMGTNRSKLAHAFKEVLGLGVFEWLREQRMKKAQRLLLDSHLSIQEIAFEVGYENCAHFSTAYKRQFDLSPSRQRKCCGNH